MAVAPTPFYARAIDYANGERILSPALAAEAETLPGWEPLDGQTRLLRDRPADFGTPAGAAAFPATFRHWHTAHQLEWIKARTVDNHTAALPGGGTASTRAVSLPLAGSGETLDVVLTNGQRGVAVLNDMTARQLRGLSSEDQFLVASRKAFGETVAKHAGLRPRANETVDLARAAIKEPIETAAAAIRTRESSAATALPAVVGKVDAPGTLTLAAMDALLGRLDTMAVFDEVAIATAFAALQARDARLAFYGEAYRANKSPLSGFTTPNSARSADGDAAIRSAYELFALGEARLAFLIDRTAEVTAKPPPPGPTATPRPRELDVGGLVYAFQLYENNEREVEAEAETEEVRQRNELLRSYAEVQRIINATSASIPPPDKSSDGTVTPKTAALAANTIDEKRVAAMFDTLTAAPHPVEEALNLSRPLGDLLDANGEPTVERSKADWDLLASSISAAVRVLDRDVQARSNAVNATSRERTRHFDLATDTLNRMSGMVQAISRGIN